MRSDTLTEQKREGKGTESIPELCDMAVAGLLKMLDPERHMFCEVFNRTDKGMSRERLSSRYTTMALLGLHRYEQSSGDSPIAMAPVLDALLHDTHWIGCAGDLGLLLWTCAELAPERLPEVYQRVKAENALERFADGQRGATMEVAWFLTGIASCYLAGYADLRGLAEQAVTARNILEANCGTSGVYGHLSRSNSLAGHVRGRIGSFADQVYPTIAFARLSHALRDEKAAQMAIRTAKKMCELQAPLGEWCWQYDSVSGGVVSRYPVYSVHQHAMGPMMLLSVSEATGCEFREAIDKSLAWISGNNELHRNFVEPSLGVVWRCIYLDSLEAYTDAALRFMLLRSGAADASRLKVRYECRPYELGWLLYAFAGR
jgi:hypothetical protein